MKCPQCGQWNRAHLPVCGKCGAALPQEEAAAPAWQKELRESAKSFQRTDADSEELYTDPDAREALAQDMANLKVRKEAGQRLQRRLRENAADKGIVPEDTALGAQAGAQPGNAFWRLEDDPSRTVRVRQAAPENTGDAWQSFTAPQPRPLEADRTYNHFWADGEMSATVQLPPVRNAKQFTVKLPSRRRGRRLAIRILLTLLFLVLAAAAGFFGWKYYQSMQAGRVKENAAIVTESTHGGLPAHTVRIPGNDGEQIYIRELRTSYIVTGGFATIEVEDHTWYDDYESFLNPTMDITLTPFLKTASGQQRPLDPVVFQIDIPESPIEVITPSATREEVAATMYTMEIDVRPGSKVTINGSDVSDTVNSETGRLSYNATVQPIGDNIYTIAVRSQYCRETAVTIVLYRPVQEIPLDLAADTYTSTSQSSMAVHMTTMPGAYIEVLSPHTDLDITNINTTGAFSFYATWDHIGDNYIEVQASAEGKMTSTLRYKVYYVPPAAEYTKTAWPMNDDNYAELLTTNIRADRGQVYVLMGEIEEILDNKNPQRAIFVAELNGVKHRVALYNYSRTTWVPGQYYRIYADATGRYDNMPMLNARYTYTY